MNTTLFICCSPQCPPLLLVSPSDPTLTVENVTEVMEKVRNWERVGYELHVPYDKRWDIELLSTFEREKSRSLGRYWVNTVPGASWRVLGHALYTYREETALAMVKQYLPKGM